MAKAEVNFLGKQVEAQKQASLSYRQSAGQRLAEAEARLSSYGLRGQLKDKHRPLCGSRKCPGPLNCEPRTFGQGSYRDCSLAAADAYPVGCS